MNKQEDGSLSRAWRAWLGTFRDGRKGAGFTSPPQRLSVSSTHSCGSFHLGLLVGRITHGVHASVSSQDEYVPLPRAYNLSAKNHHHHHYNCQTLSYLLASLATLLEVHV